MFELKLSELHLLHRDGSRFKATSDEAVSIRNKGNERRKSSLDRADQSEHQGEKLCVCVTYV